jgi:hypothetical protein
MEKLILSQKLAGSYKDNNENLPHVQVRNKMREREPGATYAASDRLIERLTSATLLRFRASVW